MLDRALELNPKTPIVYSQAALHYAMLDPNRSIALAKQGLALDPKHPAYFPSNLARAYFVKGDYQASVDWGTRCANENADFDYCYEVLAWSYAMLGKQDLARSAGAELLRRMPRYRTAAENPLPADAWPLLIDVNRRIYVAARVAGIPE